MYGVVEIDIEKNREAGIEPETLHSGSHSKLWVRCTNCNESMLKERRSIHRAHQCPVTKYDENGKLVKRCNKCKNFVAPAFFSKSDAQKSGFDSYCKDCNLLSREVSKSTFGGYLRTLISLKNGFSRFKKLPESNLSIEFLTDIWERQDGLCYYTRIPMDRHDKKSLNGASLERIDSSKGYVKDNVVWACYSINLMKNSSTSEDFFRFMSMWEFCKNFTPDVRTEHKLIHPDAKTPTKAKDTDAGHDIYSIEEVTLEPGTTKNVRTGVIIAVPRGYYMTIEGRSSLFKNGVIPARGIIDSTYTGELIVALTNQSHEPYKIAKGDRLAQFIVHDSVSVSITPVTEFSPEYSSRGVSGFGSTGK